MVKVYSKATGKGKPENKRKRIMAMFYHFSQNNSGGSFDFDKNDGITHHVVIEAVSAESANKKLQDIGGYFDGCDTGRDCSCCGDRW